MWHEHGGASSIFGSHASSSPPPDDPLSPKKKKHHFHSHSHSHSQSDKMNSVHGVRSKRSTINYLQNSVASHAEGLGRVQAQKTERDKDKDKKKRNLHAHRPAQIFGTSLAQQASLKSAIDKVVAFKKRRAPIRLNPMESLVSSNQPVPDAKDVSARVPMDERMRSVSKAKNMAKNKKSEFKLRRSEVQTPEVMGYMKKLWEDEGGLNFYEREHEHEHEPDNNPADKISVHNTQANNILDSWVKSFDLEQSSYDSISVFAEVRLKEALAATEELVAWGKPAWESERGPSAIRAALCCDLLRKIGTMFGRYKGVMDTLTSELLRCIYEDYGAVIDGGQHVDARVLYRCSPYFDSLKNCKVHRDELIDELQVYNDGIDLRKALVKCSVGVKTMFNDARRAIRDMIFKVWAAYVRGRAKKAKRLKSRVQLSVWFKTWKERYKRFREHGYFYDSESDQEEEVVSDLEMEEVHDLRGSMRSVMAMRVSGMNAIAEDADSSYEKLKERMQQANSPAMSNTSGSSDGTKSPTPLNKFKSLGRKTIMVKTMGNGGNLSPNSHKHKSLKIIKEITEASGRIIMQCERRRCHVDLTSVGCQTDPVSISDMATTFEGAAAPAAPKEPDTPKNSSQASLKSVLGGKKEKPMSIENAMTLVPSIYEQYLTMLQNPGPDTIGKHLNMATFTKNSLVRKYGLKNVAMKQFRAFAACLQTKKALKLPRLKVFASLYGLPTVWAQEAKAYDPEYVDFFFKRILEHTFFDPKHCNAILAAKGRSDIEKDKFIERMENIFPHFQKKDGFKFIKLQQRVDGMTANVVKGIDMVDADEIIEEMIIYWRQETFLAGLTWKQNRSLRNFQQYLKARTRRLKKEHEMEHRLEDKWRERFGNENFNLDSQEELNEFCHSIGIFAGAHTMEKLLEKLKAFEKLQNEGKEEEGTTVAEYFAEAIWHLGIRLNSSKKSGEAEGGKGDKISSPSSHSSSSPTLRRATVL